MRAQRLTTRFSLGATLALALAAAVPAPARAADDDVPIDTKIFRSMMHGLGLQRPGEGGINYQERAPLVIPPDKDLPPPQLPGAAIANNPAWPKDPDVARAKLEAAQARNRDTTAEYYRDRNPLPPDQLAGGNARSQPARGAAKTPDNSGADGYGLGRVLSSTELGFKSSLFGAMFDKSDESENAKFTGEPARTTLTEPPAGYQVPSPDQPYGLGKTAAKPKADNSYETRGEMRP